MLVLIAALGWTTYWAMGTCRALDRLLGHSGCVSSYTVEGFDPVRHQPMSVPDEHGIASLFGWTWTADGWRPGMVRLSPLKRRELSRYPVRAGNAFGIVVFSTDGTRAYLGCVLRRPCLEDGDRGAIVSLDDARVIEVLSQPATYVRVFPGEAEPAPQFDSFAQLADGGRTVVAPQRDDSIRLYSSDGAERAVLIAGSDRRARHIARLSVSPSGRYVALVDAAPTSASAGTAFHIWDARTGAPVDTVRTDNSYSVLRSLVWTQDERHVIAIRQEGGNAYLDVFAITAEEGVDDE